MSLHRLLSLFLVLTFVATQGVTAQPADSCAIVLSGVVLDEHDRQPLSYSEVFIPALGKGSVADAMGRYRIEGLCAGTYLVKVAHLGCEPVMRQMTLSRSITADFMLEHHAEELRELEVVQKRPDENVGHARQGLDRRAMDERAGGALADMITVVPGVAIQSSGPTIAKPMVHGLSGNRVLTLNQGVRQEDQQWGTEHAPSLDPLSSDRITVVKGAASVQYGSDAIGGVVVTEPVELPREAGIGGELRSLGVLNGRGGGASGVLQGGVKGLRGLGWRVQGSGRMLGDSESARYTLSNTGLREAGASAAIGYRDHRWSAQLYYSWFGRELGILRAAHIGNLTDLANAIASGRPWYIADPTYAIEAPRQVVQHHLLKAEATMAVSDRSRLALTYAYQANDRQEYDIRRSGRSALPSLDLYLATHTAEAVLKHWIGPRLHGKVGVNALLQDNANIPGTGVRPLLPDYRKESTGFFILEHLPVGDRFELEAGARIETTRLAVARFAADGRLEQPEHAFLNHALSIGANWSPADRVGLRFNLSSAFRPPHVSELYSEGLHHGAAAIELGDPALGSERALKGVLDAQASAGRVRIDATLHAALIDDFIYLRPDGTRLTIRGAFPVFRYVATDAWVTGADLAVRVRLARGLAWHLRGSTVRGRDLGRDEWLFQMPSDRVEQELRLNRPRGAWTELAAGAISGIVGRQQRIPEALDFAAPPGGYHLLGFTASAARPWGTGEIRFGLRAANALNMAYRDYLDRFRYYADARGLDVSLWITYRFGRVARP